MSEAMMEFTQKPPKHWDELITLCNELTHDTPEITRDIALRAFDAAAGIDNKEDRAAVHYFGMGKVACHFAQLLEKPTLKQHTIEMSANAVAIHVKKDKEAGGVMRVKHIAPKSAWYWF